MSRKSIADAHVGRGTTPGIPRHTQYSVTLPLHNLSRYIGSNAESKQPSQPRPAIAIAIMAAGKGTRLKSKHPKVLHEVGGKPLLAHVIAAATKVVPASDVFAIIGHEADRVRERRGRHRHQISFFRASSAAPDTP